MKSRMILLALALAGICLGGVPVPALCQNTVTLRGRVFEDVNGDGNLDSEDRCVDAQVTLRPGLGGPEKTSRVDCTQDNFYHIPMVTPGKYTLTVQPTSAADFEPTTESVMIPEGVDEVRHDVPIRRRSGIAGRVWRDADGDGRVSAGDAPLPGVRARLTDAVAGGPIAEVLTGEDGSYHFTNLRAGGSYLIESVAPAGLRLRGVFPGAGAQTVGGTVILIAGLKANQLYGENNFLFAGSLAARPAVERLLAVGERIERAGGLGIFGFDPRDHDRDVSLIRRVASDGSVYVLDYAGAALLRLTANSREVLLDTSDQDPEDKVGLARLLRVEIDANGISGVVALRADRQRGIYRLDVPHHLKRLALLPERIPAELAISDDGEIAYVAPVTAEIGAPLGLFRTTGVQRQELLEGLGTEQFTELSMNGGGDLSMLISDGLPDSSQLQQVLRVTRSGAFTSVAESGRTVTWGRNFSDRAHTGPLTRLKRPRIGPDGSVVFEGAGNGFVNFFVEGPQRPLQPLLNDLDWSEADDTFDYDIGPGGNVALRAAKAGSSVPLLFVIAPGGGYDLINNDSTSPIQPVGHPVLGPAEQKSKLFFLAMNTGGKRDRNGHFPAVLCRSLVADGRLVLDPEGGQRAIAVALPGATTTDQPILEKPEAVLLTLSQRPVVSGNRVVFGALFSDGGSSVPTAGLFQAPLESKLMKGASLLAAEGDKVPDADRVAILRDLSYTENGTLIFSALLPGAGLVVASLNPGDSAGDVVSTQAVHSAPAVSLLLSGDDLGGGRRFLAGPTRLAALGPDRHLLMARYSRGSGGAGEGLFSIGASGSPQTLAAQDDTAFLDDPAHGVVAMQFKGFGYALADSGSGSYSYWSPSVSSDGRLVFKAELRRGETTNTGLFYWNGTGGSVRVALADERLWQGDLPPYSLEHWAVSASGRIFLQVHSAGDRARLLQREAVDRQSTAALQPVAGADTLKELLDFTLGGDEGIYAYGRNTTGGLGLFRLDRASTALSAMRQDAGLPLSLQGGVVPGLFNLDASPVQLMPASTRGLIYFLAGVSTSSGARPVQGLFRYDPATDSLRTVLVEGLSVDGSREVAKGTLALGTIYQSVKGTTVVAYQGADGRWELVRSRPVRNASTGQLVRDNDGNLVFQTTTLAREGDQLPDKTPVQSLDPSRDLNLQTSTGPVFAVSPTGDVAFLASDGNRWGIYQFSGTAS
jgi:hypothetical protein